jgi:hypothetical protein
MNNRLLVRVIAPALFLIVGTNAASAACINRFVSRSERPHQVVTLLTGKLTFQEAQTLATAIKSKQAPPLEWVDDSGKTIAKQWGELKVVRPMPVGCDGKTSGVVIIVSFPTGVTPTKQMTVKLDPETSVVFEQQAD